MVNILTLIWVTSFPSACGIGFDKHFLKGNIVNSVLPIGLNICLGCSKEPSH